MYKKYRINKKIIKKLLNENYNACIKRKEFRRILRFYDSLFSFKIILFSWLLLLHAFKLSSHIIPLFYTNTCFSDTNSENLSFFTVFLLCLQYWYRNWKAFCGKRVNILWKNVIFMDVNRMVMEEFYLLENFTKGNNFKSLWNLRQKI